jgi:hypothetical protein
MFTVMIGIADVNMRDGDQERRCSLLQEHYERRSVILGDTSK